MILIPKRYSLNITTNAKQNPVENTNINREKQSRNFYKAELMKLHLLPYNSKTLVFLLKIRFYCALWSRFIKVPYNKNSGFS